MKRSELKQKRAEFGQLNQQQHKFEQYIEIKKMGPRNSKQSQVSFMKDYEVIQQNPTQNLTFLQHKNTQQEYLLKQFNFNDKKQCEKTMEKLAELKIKLSGNKHVVPLKDYLMSSEDQYCSTFYKIYALFQYPQRTLDDEVNQRKLQRKKFTETQLWSILASCIVGLSHLQKNNIKHSALKSKNILISKQGVIKISDPLAIGQLPNYDSALTKRSTQHVYLSPQQTQALQQQNISPNLNSFKSDIWTLGMIMLQAGLLQYQDEQCYRDQKSRIHWETVQYNIDRFGQAYSDEIKNMVEFMLSRDERARPDWIDLQAYVMKGGDQARRSFIQDQSKVDNTFSNSNSNSFNVNEGNQISNKGKIASSQVNPPQNQVPGVVTGVGISEPFNKFSPRAPINQPQPQPNFVNPNATFGRNTRPLSPRFSHSSSLYSQQPINPGPIQLPVAAYTPLPVPMTLSTTPNLNPGMTMASTLTPSFPIHTSSSFSQSGYNSSFYSPQQPLAPSSNSNIPPIRVSSIDQTRPSKNIFPNDTYKTKTKFDENLIIMTEDDYQTAQNWQQGNGYQNEMNTNKNPLGSNITASRQPPNYQTQSTRLADQQTRQTKPYSTYTQAQPQTFQATSQRPNTFGSPNIQLSPDMKFVTEQFKMGSRYQGYKLNGLRHGYGKFYYQDGGMYDGEWRENKMEGFGKLYYQSGKLAYEGDWRNDQFMGKGVLYNQIPDVLNRPFNYTNFDDVEEFWTKYEGEFADDMKNGKGILYLSNGEKFQGNFVADSVEGPGVFYCQNGTRVAGNWVGNRKLN